MGDIITSPYNPTIKLMKSLHMKKYRDEYGLYFVEGPKMVREALAQGNLVHTLVYSQDFRLEELESNLGLTPEICVDANLFRQIGDVKTPQGVMAVVRKRSRDTDMVFQRDGGFWVLLDRIQDPGNLGTIIRTMDAAGGSGVVLLEGCVDPYNPKVIRSTMGSIFRVPIVEVNHNRDFLSRLRDNNVDILASALEGVNIFNWKCQRGETIKALVIGNESQGIGGEIHDFATTLVSIPMAGEAESLNASVAAGIMIYEIMRKEGSLGQEISCIS